MGPLEPREKSSLKCRIKGLVYIYFSDGNECESLPCLNNGSCWEKIRGYQCNCTAGFNGTHCEKSKLRKLLGLICFGQILLVDGGSCVDRLCLCHRCNVTFTVLKENHKRVISVTVSDIGNFLSFINYIEGRKQRLETVNKFQLSEILAFKKFHLSLCLCGSCASFL